MELKLTTETKDTSGNRRLLETSAITVVGGAVYDFTLLGISNSEESTEKQISWVRDCLTTEFEDEIGDEVISGAESLEELNRQITNWNSRIMESWNSKDFSGLPDMNFVLFKYFNVRQRHLG